MTEKSRTTVKGTPAVQPTEETLREVQKIIDSEESKLLDSGQEDLPWVVEARKAKEQEALEKKKDNSDTKSTG